MIVCMIVSIPYSGLFFKELHSQHIQYTFTYTILCVYKSLMLLTYIYVYVPFALNWNSCLSFGHPSFSPLCTGPSPLDTFTHTHTHTHTHIHITQQNVGTIYMYISLADYPVHIDVHTCMSSIALGKYSCRDIQCTYA